MINRTGAAAWTVSVTLVGAAAIEIRAALERTGPTIINAPIRGWV